MIDIVDRLSFDATRCEVSFSKGVASNIEEAVAEITRLRALAMPEEVSAPMLAAAYGTVLRGAGEHVRLSEDDVIDLYDNMRRAWLGTHR